MHQPQLMVAVGGDPESVTLMQIRSPAVTATEFEASLPVV
jgi:hypothetical protein